MVCGKYTFLKTLWDGIRMFGTDISSMPGNNPGLRSALSSMMTTMLTKERDVDFSTVSFSAVFVIHDDGLDWALTTQLITELLMSENGTLGSSKAAGELSPIPLFFTNPDLIWST